ncbi:MAG: FliI/YscN family ATPase [Deltaproteobacteria bacterium]|nr:FliI/YscN family ATPase [Deltaproteobacteria bacterium]
MGLSLKKYIQNVNSACPIKIEGQVNKVIGTVIEGNGPAVPVGGICHILSPGLDNPVVAEAIGFRDHKLLLMPLSRSEGVEPGSIIRAVQYEAKAYAGSDMLGRIIDGLGNPLDNGPPLMRGKKIPLYSQPMNPLHRARISEPLDVGIKSINSMVSVAKGQRMAIMAGSGVGKSILLGMIARYTKADVNIIALIGERGREVREFIERDLGDEGLKRSAVIVATSDSSPLIRIRGAYLAATVAEYFRDQGKDVLLMMDSITRFAMAAREVGLSAGEPPASKAYPPSTFAHLPRLLERAGTSCSKGSITGLYTVLVEGDDMNEPIADAVRSIVDGHIVLNRDLASKGHYPAVDVLSSVSRLMNDVMSKEHIARAYEFRRILSDYAKIEDLVNLGAYVRGNNRNTDYALDMIDNLNSFLRQDIFVSSSLEKTYEEMGRILAGKKAVTAAAISREKDK